MSLVALGGFMVVDAAPSQAALVSACTGASLPASRLTTVLTPLVTGIFTPLVGIPVIGPTLLGGVGGIVTNAVAGKTIGLDVLDTSGNVVAPGAACNTTATSFTLDTPAGIAIGGNSITGLGSGTAASAGALGAIAFGNGATTSAGAGSALALGATASVTGASGVAIGSGATSTGTNSVALGAGSNDAGVANVVSVGTPGTRRRITNLANGTANSDAVNLGQLNAVATGSVQYDAPGGVKSNTVTLVGGLSGTVGVTNVSPATLSAASTDAVNGSQLFATNANVTTNTNTINTLVNGTAGLVQQATGTAPVTVAAASGGTVVNITGTAGTRTLSGVSAGTAATDAVNVGQLTARTALLDAGLAGTTAALGGGAAYNPATGVFTAPSYTVQGTGYTNVGAALGGLDTAVTTNTTNIAANTGNITNLLNGTAGLVQQANGTAPVTVAAASGGTSVTVAGTAGNRTIGGVANGVALNDAATVGQLNTVGAVAANSVQYDTSGGVKTNTVTLAGGLSGTVGITNVTAGAVGGASTDAVNGSQLFATNTGVGGLAGVVGGTYNAATGAYTGPTYAVLGTAPTTVQGAFDTYNSAITGLTTGTTGLVRQAAAGAPITVGAATDGTTVDVTGTAGARTLSGVAAGVAATDAVNVGQLATAGSTIGTSIANNFGGGAVYDPATGTVTAPSYTVQGTAYTNVGGALGGLDTAVTGNTTAITSLTTTVTNGTVGTVQRTGTADTLALVAAGGTGAAPGTAQVLSNVAAGVAPTDAANVGQVTAAVGTATANAVQYDTAGGVRTNTVTLAGGLSGTVRVTNVSAGALTAGSTDAVNGGQVNTLGTAVAGTLGGGAAFDPATGTVSAPTYTVGGTAYGNVGAALAAQDTIGGALGASSAANLGGGAVYNPATGTVSAPTYTVQGTAYTNAGSAFAGIDTALTGLAGGTIGLVQQAGPAAAITVGAATGGTAVDFTGTAGPRTLAGVAAGVAPTDAANVGQVNAVGALASNSVQYDTAGGVKTNTVTLAGANPGDRVKVTNIADGTVAAGSTDAVTGGQLFATNAGIAGISTVLGGTYNPVTGAYTGPTFTVLGGSTTTVQGAFDSYNTAIGGINTGTSGIIQRTGPATNVAVLTASGGTAAAPGAAQVLSNVAAGTAATDAVNVGQLNAVGATAANSVQYDTVGGVKGNSITLAGGAAGPVTVTNVAAGTLAAGSTDAVNGAQLAATNAQVTTNTTNIAANTANIATNTTAISTLSTSINNGSVGLVQQTGGAPGSGQITVGASTGGASVSIAGTGGTRTLTGLKDGVNATDAVTVAQINNLTGGQLNVVQYDNDGQGGRSNTVTLTGGAAGPVKVTNVGGGSVAAGSTDAVNGGQLAATNAQVAANTSGLAATNTQVAANTANIVTNTTTINSILTGQAGAFRANNAAARPAPTATGANAVAGGFGAQATAAGSLALGAAAVSTGTNSVALGAGSNDGGVANVVSVGTVGGERRITNVGPAVSGTDAVNLAQLQSVQTQFQTGLAGVNQAVAGLQFDLNRFKKRANAGTAGAMAVAGLPQAFTPGAGLLAAAVGTWQDQVAFAIGASKIIGDQVIVKAGASFSTRGSGGANAGVGIQF